MAKTQVKELLTGLDPEIQKQIIEAVQIEASEMAKAESDKAVAEVLEKMKADELGSQSWNNRVEVEMLQDNKRNGVKKGEKKKVHPATAELFVAKNIAKKV